MLYDVTKISKKYNVSEDVILREVSYLQEKICNNLWSDIHSYYKSNPEELTQAITELLTGVNLEITSFQRCFDELVKSKIN